MNTKKNVLLGLGSAFAALVLVGCGGGGSSTTASTGYLVDSAVANADYDCVADGTFNKKTGPDGSFTCKDTSDVRFRIGHLVLGEIHGLPSDKHVFPQDLLGVGRDVHNTHVAAMAQLLQAIDSDGNPENGITITAETQDMVETETEFNPSDVSIYLNAASISPEHIPTHATALTHLTHSEQAVAQEAANAGVNAGNAAANAGVAAGNAAANAGVAAGQSAANAGVNAGQSAANAGVDAGNAAANAGVAAGQSAANAGVNAGQSAANAGVNAGNAAANAGVDAGHHAANAGVQAGTDATNAISGALGHL